MDNDIQKNNFCAECQTKFNNTSNLRRHVKQYHADKITELAPITYKNKENYNFCCTICKKHFNHLPNLHLHMQTHDIVPVESNTNTSLNQTDDSIQIIDKSKPKRCPLCKHVHTDRNTILLHFKETHGILMKTSNKEFLNIEMFSEWKQKIEDQTTSQYIKQYSISNIVVIYKQV